MLYQTKTTCLMPTVYLSVRISNDYSEHKYITILYVSIIYMICLLISNSESTKTHSRVSCVYQPEHSMTCYN